MDHIKTSPELIDAECTHWLKLLLQLIDITGSNPTSHLRRFITGEESIVCKKYRKRINKIVSQQLKYIHVIRSYLYE